MRSWIESRPDIRSIPAPDLTDGNVASLTAGLVELFADRLDQPPPPWTASIGKAANPVYFVRAVLKMNRLRALCEKEGPGQLSRRGCFAPPDYLKAV